LGRGVNGALSISADLLVPLALKHAIKHLVDFLLTKCCVDKAPDKDPGLPLLQPVQRLFH
jgi:hypothetical protein